MLLALVAFLGNLSVIVDCVPLIGLLFLACLRLLSN
uniref:Uncharacterized protein n=1 Tax=Anguilla anguilla TaxID=7936 RepID=A0A0E9Q827_ANGAN